VLFERCRLSNVLQKKNPPQSGGFEIYWQAPRARCHCHWKASPVPLVEAPSGAEHALAVLNFA